MPAWQKCMLKLRKRIRMRKEALLELIPEKNIMDYQYRPMISDATKNYLNSEVLKSDLPKYGKLYVSIG